ncbi:MAG: cadherin domain-containing protein [Chitinophagales bacterium]|nr:cadherin domain-containing protein [Chitinophagales bacterium]
MRIFYVFLSFLLTASLLQAQVSEAEFEALKAIYNSTGGSNWKENTGWVNIKTATKNDVTSEWHGLIVEDGHVRRIDLRNNNLIGYLPTQIGALEWLDNLTLEGNKLEGSLPASLGNMTELTRIQLSRNLFSGPWPENLKQLKKLEYMIALNNPFNCPFPNEIIRHWEALKYIELESCGLTGELEDIFMNTANLSIFGVVQNKLTGDLPPSLNTLNLRSLYLSSNNFSGSLPTLEGSVNNIDYISVYGNKFTGNIPESYKRFTNLEYFDAGDNNLFGKIPVEILAKLERFNVNANFFTFDAIEPIYDKIKKLSQYRIGTDKNFPLNQSRLSFNEGKELVLNAKSLSVYELGGNNNRYIWYLDGQEVYIGNDPTYTVPNAQISHAGNYHFEVTNTIVPDLKLKSDPILVSVVVPDNQAPSDIQLTNHKITENHSGIIGNLSAVDADKDDTHVFLLAIGDGVNDRDNYRFTIIGNTLIIRSIVDYEKDTLLYVHILASDLKGGETLKAFTIEVIDEDEGPQFINQITRVIIDETLPNGSTVVYLLAQAEENKPVTYTIESGNEDGAFSIDEDKIVVFDQTKLNYDVKNQYVLKVSANDGKLSTKIDITITLSKINKMPVVEHSTYTIAENAAQGTFVGEIRATDPEGAPLTYVIIKGNTDEAFRLEDNKIFVNHAIALDYEVTPVFNLIVNVSDGISNVQAVITIQLTNQIDETGREILSFTFDGIKDAAVINPADQTITATISGKDITTVYPIFTISKGATSNPQSGSLFDFSTPQTIVVTSETGVTKTWTVRVTFPVSIQDEHAWTKTLKLYPNPSGDWVNISGLTTEARVFITDMVGKLVMTKSVTPTDYSIRINTLSEGMYMVVIETTYGIHTMKLMKE